RTPEMRSRRWPGARRLLGMVAVAAVTLLLMTPAAAQAHSETPPPATNYLTRVTALTPTVSGLSVRVIRNGMWLELTNHTGRDVEVLGYSGEPYLRVTSDAAYANTHSPSVYVNSDVKSDMALDHVNVDPQTAPQWRRVSGSPVIRWHDHRTHWMSRQPPPIVAAAPHRKHRLSQWSVELRIVDSAPAAPSSVGSVVLRGTLDYFPPPHTGAWYAGMAAGLAGVVLLGLAAMKLGGGPRSVGRLLAFLLLVAAAAELTDSVGRVMDVGATGFGIVIQLLATKTYGTLASLAALAAVGFAIRGHAGALLSLALSGGSLAVLGAVADLAVFSHSRATLPWSGELARLCTGATLVLGCGVAIIAWLAIKAEKRRNAG
ncbi:MAG: hypothetical protein ACRD3Q_18200, partial [Terriglobales bacterium]